MTRCQQKRDLLMVAVKYHYLCTQVLLIWSAIGVTPIVFVYTGYICTCTPNITWVISILYFLLNLYNQIISQADSKMYGDRNDRGIIYEILWHHSVIYSVWVDNMIYNLHVVYVYVEWGLGLCCKSYLLLHCKPFSQEKRMACVSFVKWILSFGGEELLIAW